MPFLNNLVIESNRGTDFYTLEQPLSYEHLDVVYTAPKGFKTDFASIPNPLRGLIDEDESDIRDAAVIHDWLYSKGEIPRIEADKVLRAAMIDLGASWFKANVVYAAVRAFGGGHYGSV